ncbi:MAG: NADPH-dependent glutamate synthase [Coriobacteriia bacterium]|nr:NADPH-dependent glutamate synthase [Coriobacteriia bacterium]
MADQSPRNAIPEQDPKARITNFDEVALGYSEELAIAEASRCWQCKRPRCINGCPVMVDIPAFNSQIAAGDFLAAYQTIVQTNLLPAICGRVCPQESQCELVCVRGNRGEAVAIGRLERFAADWFSIHGDKTTAAQFNAPIAKNDHKVAIVGAGPASLTCAADLAHLGYAVCIYEAFPVAGGVLVYGIPEFRLPKSVVAREVENLTALGVNIVTNTVVGRTITIDELMAEGYEAVFVGTGAGLPSFLGIPGENLLGVYSANEFLTRINLMKAYLDEYDTPVVQAKKALVIGGGNVAMDAARSARRLGADVTVVYRRGEDELPARIEEVHHAQEEGIEFCYLANPVSILGGEDRKVTAVECVRMELGGLDDSNRRSPAPVKGSNFTIEADVVIVAIGTSPNPLISKTTEGLLASDDMCLVIDENGATSKLGVFAGGDIVTGSATVIQAMGAGKTAAQSIDHYIRTISE